MEEQQRNIDEVFRESLGGYLEAPPGAAWQQLSRRMDEEDNGPRRRVFMRWPWVALSLLMIAGCAWMVAGVSWHGDNVELNRHVSNSDGNKDGHYQAISVTDTKPIEPVAQGVAEQRTINAKPEREQATKTSTTHTTRSIPSKFAATPALSSRRVVADRAPSTSETSQAKSEATPSTESLAIAAEKPQPAVAAAPEAAQPVTMPTAQRREKIKMLTALKSRKGYSLTHTSVSRAGMLQTPEATLRPTTVANTPVGPVTAKKAPVKKLTAKKTLVVVAAAPPIIKKEAWQKPKTRRITTLTAVHKKWQGAAIKPVLTPKSLDAVNAPALATARVTSEKKTVSAPQSPFTKPIEIVASAQQNVMLPQSKASLGESSISTATSAINDSAASLLPVSDPLRKRGALPLSLAVLGGYEPGLGISAPLHISAALRLLWQASPKFSIGVQPALRYGNLQRSTLGPDGTYQRSAWRIDSFKTGDASPTISGSIDSIYNYVIHQIYDSIVVKGRSVGGTFWEVELPIILRWNLSRSWSVWGGPSLIIGGRLRYADDDGPQVYFTERKDSIAQSLPAPAESFLNYFGTSSLPQYSGYKPLPEAEQASMLRLGYLAGVGYAKNRWLAEASLHQQLSGYNNVVQPARAAYASPSVRLSIGYLLFSPKAATVMNKSDE